MPTTIFLRGGVKFTLVGDKLGFIVKRLFRPMATGVAMSGHPVEFRWRDRLFIETQPEAEYQGLLAAQAKQAEDQAKAQAEAQAKAEKDKDAAVTKAAEAFIAKYGPDPANWPENLRPKNATPDPAAN
jgi:hypothetical protein